MGKIRGRPRKSVKKNAVKSKIPCTKFNCVLCCKTFWSQATLTRHLNLHCMHKAEQETTVKNASSIIDDDDDVSLFVCPKCPKVFEKQKHSLQHFCIHEDVLSDISEDLYPYECTDCWQCFSDESHLIAHKRVHKNKYPSQKNSDALSDHSALKKQALSRSGRKYKCARCSKTFNNPSARNQHAKIHMLWCGICSCSFKTLNQLRNHAVKVHKSDGNSFSNELENTCVSAEDSPDNDTNHNSISVENMYANETNKKTSTSREPTVTLNSKKYSPSKKIDATYVRRRVKKTHICTICSKKFENNVLLKAHSVMCPRKRYMCGSVSCKNVIYDKREDLVYHIKVKHNSVPKSDQNNKSCKMKFQGKSSDAADSVMSQKAQEKPGSTVLDAASTVNYTIQNQISSTDAQESRQLSSGLTQDLFIEIPNKPFVYQLPGNVGNTGENSLVQNVTTRQSFPTDNIAQIQENTSLAYMDIDSKYYINWMQSFTEMCKKLEYPISCNLFEKMSLTLKVISDTLANPVNKIKERENYAVFMQIYQELHEIAYGQIKHVAQSIFK